MAYNELLDEYISLLRDITDCQHTLSGLKDGYISIKNISGKKYPYLQYRVDEKLISEYVGEKNLPYIREQLKERAKLHERIGEIDSQLKKLEAAAGILEPNLQHNMIILRRCATMDSMSLEEREKSLAFSNAMTALEGIPAGEETENNLSRWVSGNFNFQESYFNTLRAYHLTEMEV